MRDYTQLYEDYQRIEGAIRYLEENYHRQPALKEVAESVHLSEYHFQRVFSRWAGISPKRFMQFLTKESAKKRLDSSASLLEASVETGLSSPGRLHDLFLHCEAVTPGEYKRRGEGMLIRYGFHPTPFGGCLIGTTEKGICHLVFTQWDRQTAVDEMEARWRQAELREDPEATAPRAAQVFDVLGDGKPGAIQVHLNGTNFQIKVWEALLRIPPGRIVSYHSIARFLGVPGGARAVGGAVGQNPVSYLIPCHRVIRSVGEFGDYAGGSARKKALIGWELANFGD
jgi:AraC family transcriptional regulator, regulatory protein of adaptative response / methylated-DNA-[protein]-cysteine methyltransferase